MYARQLKGTLDSSYFLQSIGRIYVKDLG